MIKRTLHFGNPAYLSLKNKQMVVRLPEVESVSKTIPIEDIGVVVLDHRQITLTSGLLDALLEQNVAVITCNASSMPIGLQLPLSGNTIQNERFRDQLNASLPLRKQLWKQTVEQKILNQASVLESITRTEHPNMKIWAGQIKSGDSENLEGRAAAYYWKNIFENIPHFVRGQHEAPPNQLLNYGYAILRAIIARALVSSGLLPTLGIHHHNRYNAYCLADDIMEPYRPYVDQIVARFVRLGNYDTLTKDHKIAFLQIPVVDVLIDERRSPLMVAATTTSASLVKCFSGEARRISYPVL
ncbi:MAG: type II CRISPR-associated endonuclease Cas1 [Bacteroidales bacterium]|nr:type II CRISPR-associated endonuclease Cas1 [Bacteroidales bacterium]